MQGGVAQRYPQFDDDTEQEAARFLACDLDARPVIRGIGDLDRLNAWTEVAKELDITGPERRALRQRRQALNKTEADVEFTPATETAAVADGGAIIDADDGQEADDGSEWEIGPSQEEMEYADEAEFQSQKNGKRRVVWDLVNSVEEAEAALDREYSKDVVSLHLTELLEERLEELRS